MTSGCDSLSPFYIVVLQTTSKLLYLLLHQLNIFPTKKRPPSFLVVFVFACCAVISQQRMESKPFDVQVLLLLQVHVGDERIRLSYDVEEFFHFL